MLLEPSFEFGRLVSAVEDAVSFSCGESSERCLPESFCRSALFCSRASRCGLGLRFFLGRLLLARTFFGRL